MKIETLLQELKCMDHVPFDESTTVDHIKLGDASQELTAVGICMFATPNVIREAAAKGCNLLIVHEPLFYNHRDTSMPYPICHTKKELLEQHGITVFRYHDYAHRLFPDLIAQGQLLYSGLSGKYEPTEHVAVGRFTLDTPMTTLELARTLEKTLKLRHLRIAGARDNPVRLIGCCFGTPGHVLQELEICDTVLTGEICEWIEGEYTRDRMQFGAEKSMIVMGHFNSEQYGMLLLTDQLRKNHPDIPFFYFDSQDVYSYTDD